MLVTTQCHATHVIKYDKCCSRRIRQSDCIIYIKLNYWENNITSWLFCFRARFWLKHVCISSFFYLLLLREMHFMHIPLYNNISWCQSRWVSYPHNQCNRSKRQLTECSCTILYKINCLFIFCYICQVVLWYQIKITSVIFLFVVEAILDFKFTWQLKFCRGTANDYSCTVLFQSNCMY